MGEEDIGDEEPAGNKNSDNVLSPGDPKKEKPKSAKAARQTG